MTYDEMLIEVKRGTENYYQDKFEIDYFIELYGVDYYLSITKLLKENKIKVEYNNIICFHNYHVTLIKECFIYLEQLERYLKSYLFSNSIIKSSSLLKEKRLKNILTFICNDEEVKNILFPKNINLNYIMEFKNRIYDYSLTFIANKNYILNEFINILPQHLETKFKSLLKELKIKYIILGEIVSYELKESYCIK